MGKVPGSASVGVTLFSCNGGSSVDSENNDITFFSSSASVRGTLGTRGDVGGCRLFEARALCGSTRSSVSFIGRPRMGTGLFSTLRGLGGGLKFLTRPAAGDRGSRAANRLDRR